MAEQPTPLPAAPHAAVTTLRCPSCGGAVAIRTPGQTVTVVCQFCNACLDLEQGQVANVIQYEKSRVSTRLALGARGTLRGQLLEVVGMLSREEDGYTWEEYLLFNPRLGYRWLVFDHGHWNLGKALQVPPTNVASTFTIDSITAEGQRFKRFHSGKAVVSYVVGEFYWRVRRDEATITVDFIAPPLMLSAERSGTEINWTRLEYLEPEEVAEAFKTHVSPRTGVAPNQPDRDQAHRRSAWRLSAVALVAALIIHLIFGIVGTNRTLFSETISSTRSDDSEPIVLGPIVVPGRKSPLEVTAHTSVNNSWIDIDASLVNDADESTYNFTQSISYYYGSDSDGSWSEGSDHQSSMIASVPPGTYHLLVEPATEGSQSSAYHGDVRVEVKRVSTSSSALWATLFLLAIYPLLLVWQKYRFEVQRWSNSEYTPFKSSGDDDDSDEDD